MKFMKARGAVIRIVPGAVKATLRVCNDATESDKPAHAVQWHA